uniref:RKF3 n=1 Tax=Arundo donax TaxID=35708 RepID=A0A0A9G191_ARUDO
MMNLKLRLLILDWPSLRRRG